MDEQLRELLDEVKKYNNCPDTTLIINAYEEAKVAHKDQKRKSGEPFFTHPLEVAKILVSLNLDCESVAAGLLHDVVEDTPKSYEDIKEKFGADVAMLVEGVTKLAKIPFSTKEEQQVENLRKIIEVKN